LFWAITGDILHVFKVSRTAVVSNYIQKDITITSAWFYFKYMFFDGRHTWIMPYLALAGMLTWSKRLLQKRFGDIHTTYAVISCVGLVFLFSLAVISLNPFKMIAKQTNYILIFIAPLCLLSGYFLDKLRGPVLVVVLSIFTLGAFFLSALEQQAIRIFTSNSKAAFIFAQQHKELPVYGMTNTERVAYFMSLINGM